MQKKNLLTSLVVAFISLLLLAAGIIVPISRNNHTQSNTPEETLVETETDMLDKAIASGKEHRQEYRGSKLFSKRCRNNGLCEVCSGNRLYQRNKSIEEANDKLDEWEETYLDVETEEEQFPAESEEFQTDNPPETTYVGCTETVTIETEYIPAEAESANDAELDCGAELDTLIKEAAAKYGLEWQLVKAVCFVESSYNPYAVSGTPDYGLMQITASILNAYGLHNPQDKEDDGLPSPFDVRANLDVGCRILREKLDNTGGIYTLGLLQYREGDGNAQALWDSGIFSTWYTESVLAKYYELLNE